MLQKMLIIIAVIAAILIVIQSFLDHQRSNMTMMSSDLKTLLRNFLIPDEGIKLFPYKDTNGFWSIGVGRNLVTRGITTEEALFLLDNDLDYFLNKVKEFSFFEKLSLARQAVLIALCFNLGFKGLLTFKNFLLATENEDYEKGYSELLDSRWAKQVGSRANRMADIWKEG
jgi:lysozyme